MSWIDMSQRNVMNWHELTWVKCPSLNQSLWQDRLWYYWYESGLSGWGRFWRTVSLICSWHILLLLECFLPSSLQIFLFFSSFIFLSWSLIILQYCSGFCHTLTWISLGFTCVPHPDPPSCLPLHPIPLGLPSAPALSTCLMHPTWAGDLFHPW